MDFDLLIIVPALIAGLIVLSTHVPLGQEVLKRGIIFIDLAIAQVAGLGVILATYFGLDAQGWEIQLIAVSAALSAAMVLNFIEKHWHQHQEAHIGVMFILAATASILLLANSPQAGEHLQDLLVGQILWVTWEQLIPVSILSVFILALWFKFKNRMGSVGFYLLFALAVTSSVQLVGVYLVFASLIIPALGSSRFKNKKSLMIGYLIGASGYALGLMLSLFYDLPSGAIIVWSILIAATVTHTITRTMKI